MFEIQKAILLECLLLLEVISGFWTEDVEKAFQEWVKEKGIDLSGLSQKEIEKYQEWFAVERIREEDDFLAIKLFNWLRGKVEGLIRRLAYTLAGGDILLAKELEDIGWDSFENVIVGTETQKWDPKKAKFSTWLFTVMRSKMLNWITVKKKKDIVFEPKLPFFTRKEKELIKKAVDKIEDESIKKLLNLFLDGYEREEIQQILKISKNKFYELFKKGVEILRQDPELARIFTIGEGKVDNLIRKKVGYGS